MVTGLTVRLQLLRIGTVDYARNPLHRLWRDGNFDNVQFYNVRIDSKITIR